MLADTPAIISAVVTDIDEDDGIVELDMTVKNTKDETRVFGTARVKLPLSQLFTFTFIWRTGSWTVPVRCLL